MVLRTSTMVGQQKISLKEPESKRRRSGLRVDLAMCALYLLAGLWVTARLWRDLEHRRVTINSDHSQFIWYLRHAVRVVTEGVNPFFTTMTNAPDGVNLMANTPALGLTIPMVPITMAFGPEVSFALLIALGLGATAIGWYLLFKRFASRMVAALAGAFCGFAPGMISHANGHINWTAQFLVPFIVLAVLRLRRARDGILLGFLVAYQALINEEALLYTALACGVLMGTYKLVTKTSQRIWPGLTVAAAIAATVLSYPMLQQFFGAQTYHGMPPGVAHYRADLASYPAFSRLSFGGASTSDKLSWNISEENTFFGWPLLLVAAVMVILLWERALVRVLTYTAGVFFILSLGSSLLVGRRNTGIPLPWLILGKVPILDHVITVRFGLVLVPILAAILAFTVDYIRDLPTGHIRKLAIAGLVAALLPILPVPIPVRERPAAPEFITSGAWRDWVPPGKSIATVPLTSEEFPTGLEWQRSSDDFKLAGGYFLGPDERGRARFGAVPRPTATLMREVHKTGKVPIIMPLNRTQFAEDAAYWQAAILVLPDNSQSPHVVQLRELMNDLAGEGTRVGDVMLWKVTG